MSSSFVSRLLTPDPSLNYGFIAVVYGILSLIAAILFALQWFEVSEAVRGFWMVPAPTIPALLWVLFLRSRQPAAERPKTE